MLTVYLIGIFLLCAGVVQSIHAFWVRRWQGFLLSFLTGVFLVVAGLYILVNPVISVAALTLLLAVYFVSSGIIKSVFSLMHRFANWGWMFVSGLLSIFLGILIWSQWPASSLFIFGLFLGIDLVVLGASWTAMGIAIGHIKHRPAF